MKIAYPMRVDVFDTPGGDLFQIRKYIELGRAAGPDGLPLFSGEILTDFSAPFDEFDIVHLTNIDRPADMYESFRSARKAGKPLVISPIHHSYTEIEAFERRGRPGMIGRFSGILSFRELELLKSFVRSVRYPELLIPTIRLLLRGVGRAQADVLAHALKIVVLTNKEREDLTADFHWAAGGDFETIRNGFDTAIWAASCAAQSRDIEVCVVGRIEPRKNQLAILEAVRGLGLSAVFVGNENPNHRSYCATFRERVASARSEYRGPLSHEETIALMRRARVHVSASWFEVSSLVDLEAFCAGCSVISSRCGGTREILGSSAQYVDPSSTADIERAISAALGKGGCGVPAPNGEFGTLKGVSWESVGTNLASLYKAVLRDRSRLFPPASLSANGY